MLIMSETTIRSFSSLACNVISKNERQLFSYEFRKLFLDHQFYKLCVVWKHFHQTKVLAIPIYIISWRSAWFMIIFMISLFVCSNNDGDRCILIESRHLLFLQSFSLWSKITHSKVICRIPSKHLPVQIQQWKHHNNLWNLLSKVAIKTSERCRTFIVNFEHILHLFQSLT